MDITSVFGVIAVCLTFFFGMASIAATIPQPFIDHGALLRGLAVAIAVLFWTHFHAYTAGFEAAKRGADGQVEPWFAVVLLGTGPMLLVTFVACSYVAIKKRERDAKLGK